MGVLDTFRLDGRTALVTWGNRGPAVLVLPGGYTAF